MNRDERLKKAYMGAIDRILWRLYVPPILCSLLLLVLSVLWSL